jgi:hypothetical protein
LIGGKGSLMSYVTYLVKIYSKLSYCSFEMSTWRCCILGT